MFFVSVFLCSHFCVSVFMFRAVHVHCVFVCVSVSSCIVCVPFLEYECRYASISVCSILESMCIFRIRVCYIVSLCVLVFYF